MGKPPSTVGECAASDIYVAIWTTALQEALPKVVEKKERKKAKPRGKKAKAEEEPDESEPEEEAPEEEGDRTERPIRGYAISCHEDTATTLCPVGGQQIGRGRSKRTYGIAFSLPDDDLFVVHSHQQWSFTQDLRRLAMESINIQEWYNGSVLVGDTGFGEGEVGDVIYDIAGITCDLPAVPNTPISGAHVMPINDQVSFHAWLSATMFIGLPTVIFRCRHRGTSEEVPDAIRYATRASLGFSAENWPEGSEEAESSEDEDGNPTWSHTPFLRRDYSKEIASVQEAKRLEAEEAEAALAIRMVEDAEAEEQRNKEEEARQAAEAEKERLWQEGNRAEQADKLAKEAAEAVAGADGASTAAGTEGADGVIVDGSGESPATPPQPPTSPLSEPPSPVGKRPATSPPSDLPENKKQKGA